jgi:hypothetical protein
MVTRFHVTPPAVARAAAADAATRLARVAINYRSVEHGRFWAYRIALLGFPLRCLSRRFLDEFRTQDRV